MLKLRRFVTWPLLIQFLFIPAYLSRSLESKLPHHEFDNIDAKGGLATNSYYNSRTVVSKLEIRGEYQYNWTGYDPDPGVKSVLQAAFREMVDLVTYVENNGNAAVLARYFPPTAQGDVTAVFRAVRLMAQPGGHPIPAQFSQPNDLNRIRIVLDTAFHGNIPTLADSTGFSRTSADPRITIYKFGWNALWQRLRRTVRCNDIGPKTNYKMHFLASLILHETLHFENVAQLAWRRDLAPGNSLDDQPGSYPCLNKAYGPYEAIKLNQRSPNLAIINIENYVWYALEIYWMWQCPTRVGPGGMFTAPKSNDIPGICKTFVGALSNTWCWMS